MPLTEGLHGHTLAQITWAAGSDPRSCWPVNVRVMPATAPAATEPKVIGRRRNQAKRETFQLAVYRGETEELWNFTVRAQMDTSSVFALSAEDSSPGRRLMGLRNFLMRVFVDDDGVSLSDKPVQVVEAHPDGEGEEPSTELVPVGDDDDVLASDTQWRIGGELFPSESLARQYADEHGSSLRRFVYIMDSPYLTVEQSALEEMVDVVVSAAADRPTEPLRGSSRPRNPRRG